MLTTRRVFLRNAVLGVLALPMCNVGRSDSRVARGCLRFDRIFYDGRRSHALTFAETARQMGARSHAISGAMDDPAFEDLRCRWRRARTPLAGITDTRVLCLLQTIASDAGMYTVLRIHHRDRGVSMIHEAHGASAFLAASNATMARGGAHWSVAAARLILNLRAADLGGPRDTDDANAADVRGVDSRTLVTWVIG